RPAPAQGPALDTATSVSADGSVIVGVRGRTGFADLDAWVTRPEGSSFVTLPTGYTNASEPVVSADGRVAAFAIYTPGDPAHPEQVVALDTASGHISPLVTLAGHPSPTPHAISADGSVIVGRFIFNSTVRGFRWTASTGMVDIGTLP